MLDVGEPFRSLFHRQYQLNSPQLSAARHIVFTSKKVPPQCGRVVEKNLLNVGGSSLGFNPGRQDSRKI